MDVFEWVIGLMFGAALLSMLARRIGLPYPSLLAVGGAAVALLPMSPTWTLDPQLALTLFVAPVLLDAAYDFSLRDLKRNWVPVAGLAVAAVGVTTAAVALVARWLIPDMPWSIAVALGAIVAPPDAAAATAVMRQIKLPHRIRTILEGESLVNDASALLVYRLAIGAAVAGNLTIAGIVPTAIAVIVGSIAVGILLSRLLIRLIASIRDVPIAIIVQFVGTFGVWILADRVGLSGVLTIVAFAIAGARSSTRLSTPPQVRIPTNAVWAAVTFVLNALAFVLIGMQLRPILGRLETSNLSNAIFIAVVVLLTAIVARICWGDGLQHRVSRGRPHRDRRRRWSCPPLLHRRAGHLLGRHAWHRHPRRCLRRAEHAARRLAVPLSRPDLALRLCRRLRDPRHAGPDAPSVDRPAAPRCA